MLTAIASVLAAIGFIVQFLKKFLVKYATFAIILGIQFTVASATILFVMAFYAFTITAFISLYNFFIDSVTYFYSNTDSALYCFYTVLNCSGISSALLNLFGMFFSALGTIMVFHLIRFTFGALKAIKDEIFKLGLLLGQALS